MYKGVASEYLEELSKYLLDKYNVKLGHASLSSRTDCILISVITSEAVMSMIYGVLLDDRFEDSVITCVNKMLEELKII